MEQKSTEQHDGKAVRMVVVDAHATGDFDGPTYCTFDVPDQFVMNLREMAALCQKHGLTEIRFAANPNLWGPAGTAEKLRLQGGEVVVSTGGMFWFTDTPAHASYLIESDPMTVQQLEEILAGGDEPIVFMSDDALEAYDEDQEMDEHLAQLQAEARNNDESYQAWAETNHEAYMFMNS